MNTIRQCIALGLLTLIVAGLTGCVSRRAHEPMRAVWVTRFDYKTQEDVVTILDNCRSAGFNTVLFQVRGNATAFYDSPYEPWAEQLDHVDPGYDPLAVACAAAHDRDLELHAWVNVMPAWRGTKPPPKSINQLYHTHPEWFWYDQNGKRQALSWFYVSLNPCLPEVRDYLVNVFADIARRYDIDGLHLDYIRFPNEHPAIPKGSGIDYPRDERTLALYHADTGLKPDDDPERWKQWRTEQVTRLVADIRAALRKAQPQAALSAAVGVVPKNSLGHYQDAHTWMERGLVDAVLPMNYTDSEHTFYTRLEPWLDTSTDVAIIPGLWFGSKDRSAEVGSAAVMGQVAIARELTNNYCIFAYSELFDSRDEDLTSQNEAKRALRAKRRELLLPFLRQLAEQDGVEAAWSASSRAVH